jgi:hypothetical protein
MPKFWMAAVLALTLLGCGGDDGRSPAAVRNDGGEDGTRTTQCQAGQQVVVSVYLDTPDDQYYGGHTRLTYPRTVAIPGHADDRSVVDRVRFVLPLPDSASGVSDEVLANGVTVVNDEDVDGDGVDDRIQTLESSMTQPIADGKFVDVVFDCVETIAWPTAGDFTCDVAGVSNLAPGGGFVDRDALSSCTVAVAPPDGAA